MSDQMVIYDSVFGNTAKIAKAIGEALGDAPVKKISEVSKADLENVKILFVGSPTRAFNPTPAVKDFLKELKKGTLEGVKATAFDTRIPLDKAEPAFLRFMIRMFGYADTKIVKRLEKAGAEIALDSEGFGVKDTEGPLADGELERAKAWAKKIL
jgi:flavodoxin I